jgi:hypothetical protein
MIKINIVMVGLAIVAIVLIYMWYTRVPAKEGYQDLYYNQNMPTVSRPQFMSNLDPNNMNMRSDPYAYGGFIRGDSPAVGNLAATNQWGNDTANSGSGPNVGTLTGETVSALRPDPSAFAISQDGSDFANMVQVNRDEAPKGNMNLQEYLSPAQLLPQPSMALTVNEDITNPSNFLFDRAIFAPLKSRLRSAPDYIRGDLNIEPVKYGNFDVSILPSVDLQKGYLSWGLDNEQMMNIQDIVYDKVDGDNGHFAPADTNQKLQSVIDTITKDITTPKLAFGRPFEQNDVKMTAAQNPFYNEMDHRAARDTWY